MAEPSLFQKEEKPEEHAKKHSAEAAAYDNLSKNVIELGSRLRVLEEQYSNLRNKGQLTDSNLISSEKEIREDLGSVNDDLLEIKRTLAELNEKIGIVSSELDNSVRQHDFKVLEKYIDLWNPSQFVTKDELKKRIEENGK